MSIDSQHQASEVFDPPIADESELRSQVLNNMLNVSTYLVSVLDPNELLTSLARRVVEVVPAVQAGLLWLRDPQQSAIQIKSLHGLDPAPDPGIAGSAAAAPGRRAGRHCLAARRADADRGARALPRAGRPGWRAGPAGYAPADRAACRAMSPACCCRCESASR